MNNEADMNLTQMALDPDNTEDRVYAQFYTHAKQNAKKTIAEGRPIFEDLPYVMIMAPGDKDNIVRRPARDQDKMRFRKQWRQFEEGKEQAQEGTPLEQWPQVTRSQCEELKYFGIHTVEALAYLNDSHTKNFMGINSLKQKALDYVEAAKGDAPFLALREENESLKTRLDMQQQQIDELIAAQNTPSEE